MVIILAAYMCLIVILILFQRVLNNYVTEGFENDTSQQNEDVEIKKKFSENMNKMMSFTVEELPNMTKDMEQKKRQLDNILGKLSNHFEDVKTLLNKDTELPNELEVSMITAVNDTFKILGFDRNKERLTKTNGGSMKLFKKENNDFFKVKTRNFGNIVHGEYTSFMNKFNEFNKSGEVPDINFYKQGNKITIAFINESRNMVSIMNSKLNFLISLYNSILGEDNIMSSYNFSKLYNNIKSNKSNIKKRSLNQVIFGKKWFEKKSSDYIAKGKSKAQIELDKSLEVNLIKELNDKKFVFKDFMKKIDNLPKYDNNTPKFHKPSKALYKAYGWTKIPPQSWSVIQKPPSKCISNTPISDEPMHKFGFPLDQVKEPKPIKFVGGKKYSYEKKKTGYFNMLKPVLLL